MRRAAVIKEFLRFPRSESEFIRTVVLSRLEHCNPAPVPLVGYWGIRPEGDPGVSERRSLEHLVNFLEAVRDNLGLRMEFTFLLTDTHALCNGVSPGQSARYSKLMLEMFAQHGFSGQLLSSVAPFVRAETWSQAKRGKIYDQAKGIWSQAPKRLRRRLLLGAKRHVVGREKLLGLCNYLAAAAVDREAIPQYYRKGVFHTYNDPLFAPLLPALPSIFLWTGPDRGTVKPWFAVESVDRRE